MISAFYQQILTAVRHSSNSPMDEFFESEIQNYFRCNTPGTFHFCFEENDSSFLQSANFQCCRVLVTRIILTLSKSNLS